MPTLRSFRGDIPLYSGLLLHDMGEERADGIPMGEATGAEFRTQPLWGVVAVGPYLHDGAADTLDDAIRLHGGEAARARDAYVELGAAERAAIVEFLSSLGGRDQWSPGLLPPAAPVPAAGEYGGPRRTLVADELERFARGRAVFDRDLPVREGLGVEFNGDSCRACHFDPVVGGAGTSGVDVTRQGQIDADGLFHAPERGTLLHHQSLEPVRPAPDPSASFFELRQTPTLLGLGLIEDIPAEALLALADPDDANGDGIRGRAHLLADGRLGRFGWKANVPTLAEFARDALTNELGLTVPAQAGKTFGQTVDGDAATDPEMPLDSLLGLTFYLSELGAPPPSPHDAALEASGARVFERAGCAVCHVPALRTASGEAVELFSDLLLHDVLPEGSPGIVDGAAGPLAFRTAPLWGLAQTAPYLHDGSAPSVEAAILGHAGEAERARGAYSALTEVDRQTLLAFLNSL